MSDATVLAFPQKLAAGFTNLPPIVDQPLTSKTRFIATPVRGGKSGDLRLDLRIWVLVDSGWIPSKKGAQISWALASELAEAIGGAGL